MELHKISLIAGKLDKITPTFTIYIILKEDNISELKSWLGYIFTSSEAVFQQLFLHNTKVSVILFQKHNKSTPNPQIFMIIDNAENLHIYTYKFPAFKSLRIWGAFIMFLNIYIYISHAAKVTGKVICNWIQFTAPRSCSLPDSSKPLCFIRTASITLRQCAIKYGKYIHSMWPQCWYELSRKTPSSHSEMPRCSSLAWKQTYISAAIVLLLPYLFCVQRISGLSITHSASFTSPKCKVSLLAIVLSNMRWNLSYASIWWSAVR